MVILTAWQRHSKFSCCRAFYTRPLDIGCKVGHRLIKDLNGGQGRSHYTDQDTHLRNTLANKRSDVLAVTHEKFIRMPIKNDMGRITARSSSGIIDD
jgi:hypothetical protein